MEIAVAALVVLVFVIVFCALYIVVVASPVNGPGWLAWPILALIAALSSAAAYGVAMAVDDEALECENAHPDARCPLSE